MPLYEFSCPTCEEKREILARSAEAAVAPNCPACGVAMEKALALVAAHTKAGESGCNAPRAGFS